MGFVSIIQGGALQDSYRALVLARAPVGQLRVSATTRDGLAGERLRLVPAAGPPLDRLLRDRGRAAYRLEATGLRPGRNYQFHFTDGASTDLRFNAYTLPSALPAAGVTIAVGSCFFDGFDTSARIDAVLRRPWLGRRPLLQFWVGDNLYTDVPSFGALSANQPYVQTLERYLRYFDGTSYMRARSATPNYTTYDDHELWNNFPEAQIHLSRDDDAQRTGYTRAGWDCLDLFQASLNPPRRAGLFSPDLDATRPARSFQFDLSPLSFFFADLRTNRDRNRPGAAMMAPGDLDALIQWTRRLEGPGVLVLGQPLWISKGGKADTNPPAFTAEYQAIWRALVAAPFDVLVVSGDVHHSRLMACSFDQAPNRFVYEFVSSPASHIPTEVTTVLPPFAFAQDRGNISPPAAIENAGLRVKAHYYFGTTAQNSLGFLGFVPGADRSVEVSAAFVDYGGREWPRIAACETGRVALADRRFAQCAGAPSFTLRRRPQN